MTDPSERSFAGGRLAPGCRIVTHNIRGWLGQQQVEGLPLPSLPLSYHKLFSLYRTWWCQLRADIILVQETKTWDGNAAARTGVEHRLTAAAATFGGPGYKVIWACNSAGSFGGVATLIRKDWIANGLFSIVGGDNGVTRAADGRLLHMRCLWAGHSFLLINPYLPSGDPIGQELFIQQRLRPLLTRVGGDCIIGGDFNFTMDWRLDRRPVPPGATSHRDDRPADAMKRLSSTHLLSDAFRHLHPTNRSFTFSNHCAASLLDRFFLSARMLPFLAQCRPEVAAVSDHRPVLLHLRPRIPGETGSGIRRTRMAFWKDPALQATFTTWLHAEIARAPLDDDHALLLWWRPFKAAALSQCRSLDRQFRQASSSLTSAQASAKFAFRQALDQLEALSGSVVQPHHLQKVLDARHQLNSAMATTDHAEERVFRGLVVREGERTSPLLTTLLSPPISSLQIAGLKTSGGGVATGGGQMAAEMGRAFAAVSKARPRDLAAEDAILDAVATHAKPIPPDLAAAAGEPILTEEEVQEAATDARLGSASGPDGLPPSFWKRGGAPLYQLLSSLYSAIGRTGDTPAGFLDGVVTPLFKAGDATVPANYRPITLLNTDYRCMTKVLASRLGGVLETVIGPEQTACLKGRLIGDNVTLLHLIPEILRSNARFRSGPVAGVLAFLDFRKAYDTINRDFLLRIMDTVGAGPGLQKWVTTILSNTSASANVNGFVSPLFDYETGVRQGCPLAPALYLFIAWALLCWLKTCPVVGLELVPGLKVHAAQYADDTQPLLRSLDPADVQVFLDHMVVFERASWQALNPSKSLLLPVGAAAPPGPGSTWPSEVCGIRVATRASSLGAVFTNDPSLLDGRLVDWENLVGKVQGCYDRVARPGCLSIFGRAQAAGSYGIGKILYQAQHNGLPATTAARLHQLTVALVDREATPPFQAGDLPGIPSSLLIGKPARGGFGMLPWREHYQARQAMAARRYLDFLTRDPDPSSPLPLWVPLVTCLLSRRSPSLHPAFALLSPDLRYPPLPLGPLRRMEEGLAALGPLGEVAGDGIQPGAWCAKIPLWGNPLLQLERPAAARTVTWLTTDAAIGAVQNLGFAEWMDLPGLHTVGDLLRFHRLLQSQLRILMGRGMATPQAERFSMLMAALYGPGGRPLLPPSLLPLFTRWSPRDGEEEILRAAVGMYQAIPTTWRSAAATTLPSVVQPQPPLTFGRQLDLTASTEAVATLVGRLGWPGLSLLHHQAGANGRPHFPLTVKSATTLQIRGRLAEQRAARQAYVECALTDLSGVPLGPGGGGQPSPAQAAQNLEVALGALWRVPWVNVHKEPLWRLSVNGVRGAGGHDISSSHPCPCGWPGPPDVGGRLSPQQKAFAWRSHHFSSCPVAEAVKDEIRRSLPPPGTLSCANLWLLQPPSGIAHAGVWGVVAAAAIAAMSYGRKNLIRLHLGQLEELGEGQTLITNYFPVVAGAPPATILERACHRAAAWFWCLLQDFASLQLDVPLEWGAGPPSSHPFLASVVDTSASPRQRIVVRHA